jgi:hypothetical protein
VWVRSSVIWVALLGTPAIAQDVCQVAASAKAGASLKVPIHLLPTSTSEVLEVAPQYSEASDGVVRGARVIVTEMHNGWARVTNVTDWTRTVSASDGWISAINIVLTPQTKRGFSVASAASKVVWEGAEWPKAEVLIDCKGEWGKVLIRGADGAGTINAWVRGFCDDPTTPCEDVVGDGG